ncbi:MAG: crossover junction endodeoxyribonuclease RuvC [Bdellovibrionales bacterium]|nr:crossover junction endodeoxyribonuclease RuvC [Bdellovibrionales bacterium]
MRLIVGLDPGSLRTGYGILRLGLEGRIEYQSHGVISMPNKLEFAARLHILHQALDKLLDHWKPSEVVVEKAFLGSNVDSAFKLGHVRGICMAMATKYNCRLREMAPRAVKKAVTGYGAASKDQVALAVATWISRDTQKMGHDATDALALALAHGLLVESEDRLAQMMERNT